MTKETVKPSANKYKPALILLVILSFFAITLPYQCAAQVLPDINNILPYASTTKFTFSFILIRNESIIETQQVKKAKFGIMDVSDPLHKNTLNFESYYYNYVMLEELPEMVYLGDYSSNTDIADLELKLEYDFDVIEPGYGDTVIKSGKITVHFEYFEDNTDVFLISTTPASSECFSANAISISYGNDNEVAAMYVLKGGHTGIPLYSLHIIARMPQPTFDDVEVIPSYEKDEDKTDEANKEDSIQLLDVCIGDKLKFNINRLNSPWNNHHVAVYRNVNHQGWEIHDIDYSALDKDGCFIDKMNFDPDQYDSIFIQYALKLYYNANIPFSADAIENHEKWGLPAIFPEETYNGEALPYYYVTVRPLARPDFTINYTEPACHDGTGELTVNKTYELDSIHIQEGDASMYFTLNNKQIDINEFENYWQNDTEYKARLWLTNKDTNVQCSNIKTFTFTLPEQPELTAEADTSAGCHGAPICSENGTGRAIIEISNGQFSGENNDKLFIYKKNGTDEYEVHQTVSNINNNSPFTVDDIEQGLYKFSATDHNGCETEMIPSADLNFYPFSFDEDNYSLIKPSMKDQSQPYDIKCRGGNSGYLKILYTAPLNCYDFDVDLYNEDGVPVSSPSPAIDSSYHKFYGLFAGEYKMKIYDEITGNHLYTIPSIILTEPPELIASYHVPTTNGYPIACANGTVDIVYADAPGYNKRLLEAMGSMVLKDDGGNQLGSPIIPEYDIFGDIVDDLYQNFSEPLSPGTYTIEITDLNGCSDDTSFTIIPPPTALQLTGYDVSDYNGYNISCAGGNNGFISNITYTGGEGNVRIYLNDEEISATGKTKLKEKDYTLVLKDDNNCATQPEAITLEEPPCLSYINKPPKHNNFSMRCHGQPDSIELYLYDGLPPYTVETSEYSKTAVEGLNYVRFANDGPYSIKVYDQNNCLTEISGMLVSPDTCVYITELELTEPSCFGFEDGKIKIGATGGNPDFGRYSLELFQGPVRLDSVFQNSHEFKAPLTIPSGEYSILVTDLNGCATDTTFFIGSPEMLNARASSINTDCKGLDPALKATVSGGMEPYSVKWTDENGFVRSRDMVFDGALYQTYYLDVEDANGCASPLHADTILHEETSSFQLHYEKTDATCFGCTDGTVNLSASGSYGAYLYSGDQETWLEKNTFASLAPGNYSFFAKDVSGCLAETNVEIEQPGVFTASISEKQNILCHGTSTGSVLINAAGGTKPHLFSKDGGTTWQDTGFFNHLEAGDYCFTVKDKYNYRVSASTYLSEPVKLLLTASSITHTLCGESQGSAVVEASGGVLPYQYHWQAPLDSSGSEITHLPFGRYVVVVTDANVCRDSTVVLISNTDGPVLWNKSATHTSCWYTLDGSASFSIDSGTPPYQIMWNNNPSLNDTLAGFLPGGLQEIQVTDDKGCGVFDTIHVPTPDTIACLSNISPPQCHGYCDGAVTLMGYGGTGNLYYSWPNVPGNPGGPQLYSLCAGTYQYQVADDKNCYIRDSLFLPDPLKNKPFAGKDTSICEGQTVLFTAGSWNQYSWTSQGEILSDSNSLMVSEAGEYILEVTDENNCKGFDTVLVSLWENDAHTLFIIAGEANVLDTLVMIEYSEPSPDSVNWSFPANFSVLLDEYPLYWLQANSAGTYQISMDAYFGECLSDYEKTIIIHGDNKKSGGFKQDSIIPLPENAIPGMEIFPNPAKNYVFVRITKSKDEPGALAIYNLYGRKLHQEILPRDFSKTMIKLDLTNYKSGFYIIETRFNHIRITKKLIVN